MFSGKNVESGGMPSSFRAILYFPLIMQPFAMPHVICDNVSPFSVCWPVLREGKMQLYAHHLYSNKIRIFAFFSSGLQALIHFAVSRFFLRRLLFNIFVGTL